MTDILLTMPPPILTCMQSFLYSISSTFSAVLNAFVQAANIITPIIVNGKQTIIFEKECFRIELKP